MAKAKKKSRTTKAKTKTKPKAKKLNTWRNIPQKDRIILWGRAAARCAFPNCRIVLVEPAKSEDAEITFGQAAHLVAHSAGGPRGNARFPRGRLDRYENLVLLCGNHHTIVDRQPNFFTIDDLRSWKDEHEKWVHARTEPSVHIPLIWQAIVQEDAAQINTQDVIPALLPDNAATPIHHLMESHNNGAWVEAANRQKTWINELIARTPSAERRFAVFSLTRIPLAIQLGHVFSFRCRVLTFQFHRETASWSWPTTVSQLSGLKSWEWQTAQGEAEGPVVIRVSLSATIAERFVSEVAANAIGEVHLQAENPSVTWLQAPSQVEALAKFYVDTFTEIMRRFGGRANAIHVLYAGPVPGAIVLGQAINLRMIPPVHLYEYTHGGNPAYAHALELRVE